MNILQINCVYGVGSTGNITRDLHQALLARGHRSAVLYGRGPQAQIPMWPGFAPAGTAGPRGLQPGLRGCPMAAASGPPGIFWIGFTGSGRMWCICNASTGTSAICTSCWRT